MKKRLLLTLMGAALGCVGTAAAPAATIRWTEYGIPHIQAKNLQDLGFGIGYAMAEKNVCLLFATALTVRGDRSRYFGPNAMALPGFMPVPNVESDAFFKGYFDSAALLAHYRRQEPQSLDLMQGFVAGANRYVAQTGAAHLPQACRSEPWVKPLTLSDMVMMIAQKAVQASGTALIGAVVSAQPPAAGAEPAIGAAGTVVPKPGDSQGGSNAYALGRAMTADGGGLLLANPHFPWIGHNRFFEMQLTIPGKLDVMGATLLPLPVVVIGFNHDIAWTHTVSTARRFTLFRLDLVSGHPLQYRVDGKIETMAVRTITVQTPRGEITHWFYETRYGPVVVAPQYGVTWTTGTAYALGDAERDNSRLVAQWLAIDEASSVGLVRNALAAIQGAPWVNTVATDRTGQVLYADYSVTPDLSDAQLKACTVPGLGSALWATARIPVLDGSRSACDWEDFKDGAHRGILPTARMPAVLADDTIFNSNDSYATAHLGQPLSGYPAIIGPVDAPVGPRTRMGAEALAALPQGRVTPDDLTRILFSEQDYWGEQTARDIATLCAGTGLAAGAKTGCAVLAQWDHRDDVSSQGATFFRAFWPKVMGIPHVWRTPFDAARPFTTPAGLAVDQQPVAQALIAALGQTVAQFRALKLPPDVALGAVQYWPDGAGGRIALPGGPNANGVLDNMTTGPLTEDGYDMRHPTGSSYIQIVHWQGGEPVANAVLAYGQSADPDSAHHIDQTRLYAAHHLMRLPFTEAEIERDRHLRIEQEMR